MSHKARVKKMKVKVSTKRGKPVPEALPPALEREPAGPPLSGAALETKVAEILCRKLRDTPERKAMREASCNADDLAIEGALASPRVRTIVEPVARAYVLEQTIALLQLLYFSARALLESDNGGSGQGTALKIVVEASVETALRRVGGSIWAEESAVLFSSAFEQNIVNNMLQLLRGQSTPPSCASSQAADGETPSGSLGESLSLQTSSGG